MEYCGNCGKKIKEGMFCSKCESQENRARMLLYFIREDCGIDVDEQEWKTDRFLTTPQRDIVNKTDWPD